MNDIKISVIIPVYNCGRYIGNTLKSVINQNFRDYEIIVVDDGSTDNSLEIINSTLKDCGVKYKVIHQDNAGVSVARNHGIDISEGEYLVFVDGDDYILENHLSELYVEGYDFNMIQFAKQHDDEISPNPNNFNFDTISTDEFIRKELNMEILFNFFQLAYRTEIIKNFDIRFTPGVVYGEDTEFALKALIHGDRIHVSKEITYYYVQRYDSAIRTTEYRRFDIVPIFENLANYYRINGKNSLANSIIYTRIPKAIFGNMNYFFYSCYGFDEVMYVMEKKDLFSKLARFRGDLKFKTKVNLFLLNPKLYYKLWFKFKNSID
ncbi:glycosyltransferase family A protein [uncultured Methanobrevibacter sp.]|jgi:glycosyltransferase involved in cell wall biosynthesis|uniref:glycosyltransferase family 2 protein n=1 Tax=uncultured Methanobrevibacter sp. TaxID=253161 RepID=UPI0026006004|nr:glycosyltransferase family A protein [uncultured Methanobrevibacter sp.]